MHFVRTRGFRKFKYVQFLHNHIWVDAFDHNIPHVVSYVVVQPQSQGLERYPLYEHTRK